MTLKRPCYTYPDNVPNLLALSFVIPAMMQALLVIGNSDITVTERNPRPADVSCARRGAKMC